MPPRSTSFQIFQGDWVTNRAETTCTRRLKRDLEAEGVDAVLLANFTLGPRRRQIDLIVATAATAIVVEIKAYLHPIHGGVNGPWSLEQDDGSRRELDGSNPYQQALENRFTVTDSLRGQNGRDIKDAVAGMLCLYPGAPVGSNIPASDFKLAIGGYAELVALLKVPRANALSLDQWRAFARAQDLTDQSKQPPSAADQIVAQYLTAYADLGRATLGPYVEPQFDGVLSVGPQPVSDRRSNPQVAQPQATSDCHSANAAERRSRKVCRSTRWRSELKWLCREAWTEANFCNDFMCRNRSIARSRRRKGRCEFSTRLFRCRPISRRSRLPSSRIAAGYDRSPSVTTASG